MIWIHAARGLHRAIAYFKSFLLLEVLIGMQNGVMLEGCLLQTSITCPGAERYSSTALRNELWSGNQALLSAEPGAAAVAREALSADAVNEVLTLSRASLRRRDLPRGGALSRLSCRRAFAPRAWARRAARARKNARARKSSPGLRISISNTMILGFSSRIAYEYVFRKLDMSEK